MLDGILFWVVLGWMVAMLVLAFLAVRDVWRETSRADPEEDQPDTAPSAEAGNESTTHRS